MKENKINKVKFILEDSIIGLMKNKILSISSILILTFTLTILGVIMYINQNTKEVINYLEDQTKITVVLDEQGSLGKLEEKIKHLTEVETIKTRTKKQAMEKMKVILQDKEGLLKAFSEEDYKDTIIIKLKKEVNSEVFIKKLKKDKHIDTVLFPKKFANDLLKVKKDFDLYSNIILFIMLLLTIVLLYLTIQISINKKREEIKIKLLHGADKRDIHLHFIFESMVISAISVMVSIATLLFVVKSTLKVLKDKIFITENMVVSHSEVSILICLIGISISITSALVACKKTIRST